MGAESYVQPHNQLDDGASILDAGAVTSPFAQHARDYIHHFLKKAAFIRAGSGERP
jgi:hypothetical protein